jgi:hypothetical protein
MSIISALIQPVTEILDKVIPDADTKQRIAHEIATQAHTIAQAQIEVNKAEAKSKDFLVIPMANFALALSGSTIVIPLIDLSTMLPVLMGMLGLGTLRTYEKTKGIK